MIVSTSVFDSLLAVVKDDPDILAVVVFGSYARNEEFRDIDVCLFLNPPSNVDKFHKLMDYISQFSSKFDISIFTDLPLYIRARVIKEGIVLLNKDYNALFDIYIDTIKDYNLFLPKLNLLLEVD
jgi:predicted nucleotidyltransferase